MRQKVSARFTCDGKRRSYRCFTAGIKERNLHGGTECVPLISTLSASIGERAGVRCRFLPLNSQRVSVAAELARKHLPGYEKKVRPLRDALEEGILSSIPNTELNGQKEQRLANTTNITFRGIESEALLILLDQEGVCASSGSACLADSDEPSHVVKAMKPESAASRQMIRFSLGRENTVKDVHAAVAAVQRAVNALRS